MRDKADRISWRQCRGIETVDLNDDLVLVQAPTEQVAQALSQLRQVVYWKRDVYEREIVIQGHGLIVFRLQGHPWTLIRELPIKKYNVLLEEKDAQSLSSLLGTKAMFYQVSDTASNIGYYLYNCGELMEKLFYTSECEEELDEEDEDEETNHGTYQFQSQLRSIKVEKIKNPYSFIENFFWQQDVYIPALYTRMIFRVGQRFSLQMKEINQPDELERMDYMVFN